MEDVALAHAAEATRKAETALNSSKSEEKKMDASEAHVNLKEPKKVAGQLPRKIYDILLGFCNIFKFKIV